MATTSRMQLNEPDVKTLTDLWVTNLRESIEHPLMEFL